jgi:hypothetical protein
MCFGYLFTRLCQTNHEAPKRTPSTNVTTMLKSTTTTPTPIIKERQSSFQTNEQKQDAAPAYTFSNTTQKEVHDTYEAPTQRLKRLKSEFAEVELDCEDACLISKRHRIKCDEALLDRNDPSRADDSATNRQRRYDAALREKDKFRVK